MFAIYVEKEFLQNLFIIHNSDNEVIADFIEFIGCCNGLTIHTDVESIDDLLPLIKDNPFWKELTRNISDIVFNEQLFHQTPNPEVISKIPPFSLFLIEQSDLASTFLKHGYLCISSSEIGVKWKSFTKEATISLNVSSNSSIPLQYKLSCFEQLEQFQHPFHSLIIVDKYLFNDHKDSNYETNLLSILDSLVGSNSSLNQSLFFFIDSKDGLLPSMCKIGVEVEERFKLSKSKVDSHLAKYKKNGSLIKLSICSILKSLFQDDPIHDRRLYTNYFLISSEAGFNIFKKDRRTNKLNPNTNTLVHFNFVFRPETMYRVKSDLQDLANYIQRLKKTTTYEMSYIPSKPSLPKILSFD